VAYEEELFEVMEPRRAARIPFGNLLEAGLLEAGQRLYLGEKGRQGARILADGSLSYNGRRGSIHQVAKEALAAPANGWQHWYYVDPDTGRRRPIDDLRQLLREGIKAK
jgi:modification methylase